jgi:hypothetical protein
MILQISKHCSLTAHGINHRQQTTLSGRLQVPLNSTSNPERRPPRATDEPATLRSIENVSSIGKRREQTAGTTVSLGVI